MPTSKISLETPLPEQQFLNLINKIYTEGVWRPVKQISQITGKPTRCKTITGAQMRFNPEDGMPFISLRNLKGAFKFFIGEMLWILSGSTHVDQLHKYGVRYWDEWCTEEKCGWYNLPVGSFGRTYGAQWRSFNAGGPEPVDQIARLFKIIEKNPFDRSLIVHPWNPYDVDHLVVKPCHGAFHLILMDGRWDMIVDQRSADVPVGIPSNLVMYKFLQMLICLKSGYPEGKLIYNMRDTHYYEDQEPGIKILLERKAKPFPKVTINPIMVEVLDEMLKGEVDPLGLKKFNPEQIPYTDLINQWVTLENYNPDPAIPKELLLVDI